MEDEIPCACYVTVRDEDSDHEMEEDHMTDQAGYQADTEEEEEEGERAMVKNFAGLDTRYSEEILKNWSRELLLKQHQEQAEKGEDMVESDDGEVESMSATSSEDEVIAWAGWWDDMIHSSGEKVIVDYIKSPVIF